MTRTSDPMTAADGVRLAHARSILALVLAGPSTFRRAAGALGVPAALLPADRAGRGLAIWREYVGQTVRTASPLLFRVCEANGVTLDDLVMKLGLRLVWDQWLCGVRPHDAWLRSLAGQLNVGDAPEHVRREWALQEWLHGGWPVYDGADLGLRFGVRVLDRGLEVAAFPGGHRLRTHGSKGSITLRTELPATLVNGLAGILLDHLIDHPLVNGAGCVITGVDQPSPRWGTKVRFALEPVPWRMPWAR